MQITNDKIFESEECKAFVKKVVESDVDIINASTFVKNNFNVNLEITDDGDITLESDSNHNSSQNLLDAKEYIQEHLSDDLYQDILFI